MITYPLNNVLYHAEDAELFNSTRSSGVFSDGDFSCLVTGADNNITIQEGIGWIKNSRFSGKVVALKAPTILEFGVADSIYPRIDAVVIRFDATKNQTELVIKQGVASANAVPPEVIRSETVCELHLYHVLRDVQALTITSAAVTDVRLNPRYCGLMADSVTKIDTSAIWAQIENLIKNADEHINDAIENHLQEAKDSGEFDGVSITSVEQTKTSDEDGGENEITVSLSNEQKSTFRVKNGKKGTKGDPGTTDFNKLSNKPKREIWNFTLEDGTVVPKAVYAENAQRTITMVVGIGSPAASVTHNGQTYNGSTSFNANIGDTLTIAIESYTGITLTVNGVVIRKTFIANDRYVYEYIVTGDTRIDHYQPNDGRGYVTITEE